MKHPESFLQWVWKHGRFLPNQWKTNTGLPITILQRGTLNSSAGPDFLDATILLGNQKLQGSVEIHTNSKDWNAHLHHLDPKYNSVILHVVWNDEGPIFLEDGSSPHQASLKGRISDDLLSLWNNFTINDDPLKCRKLLHQISPLQGEIYLDRMMVERLEKHSSEIIKQVAMHQGNWESAFYDFIFRAWGFHQNAAPMNELFRNIPKNTLQRIHQYPEKVEALLFGIAGFLNQPNDDYSLKLKEEYNHLKRVYSIGNPGYLDWKWARLRPNNFPEIRLAQLAAILHKQPTLMAQVLSKNQWSELTGLFEAQPNPYWKTHFRFNRVTSNHAATPGKSAVLRILVNVVLPFRFTYYRTVGHRQDWTKTFDLFHHAKAENNQIVRIFEGTSLDPKTLGASYGSHHWYHHYCQASGCLRCPVGQKLLQSNSKS